ncbi:MAG: tRNA 5-methoxyuridine(34)/uridine 5-oxyacetic acid(34) synthase CmoB [SAR86 cluster bacterium]|jgi:tRNA (mo5U34)-methyltransferase|nr:tRNA 5-methoxyuridine(34)/uridine 5-oxyacetic acid(34) synthase CmoB [SAR86 cluster bacterium]
MGRLNPAWKELINSYDLNPYLNKKDKRIDSWVKLLSDLPHMQPSKINLDKSVSIAGDWQEEDRELTKNLLLNLIPWRKGPFDIQGIFIDSEWNSDLKWKRFLELDVDLNSSNILDVGSGNGYYGFRMLGSGANLVVCLEPNLNHFTQFLAINKFIKSDRINMIPSRIEELGFISNCFDIVFSMGLLYHQRDPLQHLKDLKAHLKPGGRIVLETIIAPDCYGEVLVPKGKYSNMPNVWFLHTILGIEKLVKKVNLSIDNVSKSLITSIDEQSSSDWMPFRSLKDGLDPDSTLKTIEGYPRPERIFFILS